MAGPRYSVEPTLQALLRDLRVSPSRVLRRAGLPGDLFARRPIELTPAEYYRLWEAIDAEAHSVTGDGEERVLAVDIGQAISVDLFSPPVFAALCSPDLATAAPRLAAHKPLIGPLRIDIDTSAGVQIAYRWPEPVAPPALLATTELVFWVALTRIATREQVRPTRVEVATPPHPGHRRALETYLGTRVRAGHRYAVTFSPTDATRPFLTENEDMWRVLAPELRRRLHDLDTAASVAERVRATLLETLPAGDPSITAVTHRLATSPRTLQRQLRAEGTTFQAVLATTREDLARHYLHLGDLSTPDIAYLLAYDDTNSFYRAFKTWTGTTPDALRTTTA